MLSLRGDCVCATSLVNIEAVKDAGSILSAWRKLIDCTKILVERPGSSGDLQHTGYSGPKRILCPIYQKQVASDGLSLAFYGLEAADDTSQRFTKKVAEILL